MKNYIYKYELPTQPFAFILSLPLGYKFLQAGLDPEGRPCLWAEVDPELPPVPTRGYLVWTGHAPPDDMIYHGSYSVGPLMYHLYLEPQK